jgi:GT2 family glycosyltransferase
MTNSKSSYCVTASIVLYRNDPAQVRAAIRSFLSTPLNVKIAVIDNSPEDLLRSVVLKEGADYIFAGKNIGFGAAHNIAIRNYVGQCDYHLILNPDVVFGPETIPALHKFMQTHSTVGLVMPKIFYPNHREQRLCKLLPTPMDLIFRRFIGEAAKRLMRERMARYLLEGVDLTKPCFVPSLSGCFMFVRMDALDSVGLFDERFFLYLEDVDLCRRIAERWETFFYPDVSIVHEYANGSYQNLTHLRLHMVSAWKYFNKWGWLRDPTRDALNARMLK